MFRFGFVRLGSLLLAALVLSAGCAEDEPQPIAEEQVSAITLTTQADTLAKRAYDYAGGAAAWEQLPYLGFQFAIERGGQRQTVARHLWDRQGGAYRVEWSTGPGSTYVALFDVDSVSAGQVYLNGDSVRAARSDSLIQRAHGRFINDTYWLLAPAKLFDPGVQREYVSDSSDADTGVLQLSFEDVGLTPGDRYWLYVDRETGRLKRWRFQLENGRTGHFRWTGYRTLGTSGDTIRFATRKEAVGGPVAILTDSVRAPSSVPEGAFTDPAPRL